MVVRGGGEGRKEVGGSEGGGDGSGGDGGSEGGGKIQGSTRAMLESPSCHTLALKWLLQSEREGPRMFPTLDPKEARFAGGALFSLLVEVLGKCG